MSFTKRKAKKANTTNYDLFDPYKQITLPLPKKVKNKPALPPLFPQRESERQYIGQMVYVQPSYVVSMPEFDQSNRYTTQAFIENIKNLEDNTHAGIISSKTLSKMRNAVNWLLSSAEPKKVFSKKTNSWFSFKVNFVTLTLPDTEKPVTSAFLQTKLLNPFLTYLRKYHSLNNYVWKLEFQKNGKLHVHFASDTFIHHAKLRSAWNKILGSNNLLVDFYKKFGHANPNSTDVHSVRKIKNLAAYLAKYMSKQSSDLVKVKGRIWGSSLAISQAMKTKLFIDRNQCHIDMRPLHNPEIEYKKLMGPNKLTGLLRSFGEIFFLKFEQWQKNMSGQIKDAFENAILNLKQITAGPQLFEV